MSLNPNESGSGKNAEEQNHDSLSQSNQRIVAITIICIPRMLSDRSHYATNATCLTNPFSVKC